MKRDINISLLNKLVTGLQRREAPTLTLEEADQVDPLYAMLESDDELAGMLQRIDAEGLDLGVTL